MCQSSRSSQRTIVCLCTPFEWTGYSMYQLHGDEGGHTSCSFIRTKVYYRAGADSSSLHETPWLDTAYGHQYDPETFPGNRRILKRLHCYDARKDCRPEQGQHPKHESNPHRILIPLKHDSAHKRVKNYPRTSGDNWHWHEMSNCCGDCDHKWKDASTFHDFQTGTKRVHCISRVWHLPYNWKIRMPEKGMDEWRTNACMDQPCPGTVQEGERPERSWLTSTHSHPRHVPR